MFLAETLDDDENCKVGFFSPSGLLNPLPPGPTLIAPRASLTRDRTKDFPSGGFREKVSTLC